MKLQPTRVPPIQWNPFDDAGDAPACLVQEIDAEAKYFGWIPRECMTPQQKSADTRITNAAPEFAIEGSFADDRRKVGLWEALRKVNGGEDRYIWQSTGSCVGASGGNVVMTLAAVEIVTNGESEEWKAPWWLYTYGEGREIAGMRRRGSGSFGSAQAKAASTRGVPAVGQSGLPTMQMKSGWYWLPASTELEWSDGQQSPQKWDDVARSHLVKTVAKANSAADIAAGIKNGYPATIASMFGTRGTRVVGGDEPVQLAEWDASWAHQMFIDGVWDHPTLGMIFRDGNNWGPNAHAKPVDGSPPGGFWITEKTLDRICRDDCWIYSQYDGFPAQELDWNPFT